MIGLVSAPKNRKTAAPSRVSKALPFALVLLVGLATGWVLRSPQGQPAATPTNRGDQRIDFAKPIQVRHPASEKSETFTPFRYMVDGQKAVDVAPPPADQAEVWHLWLDDGRTLIQTVKVPNR